MKAEQLEQSPFAPLQLAASDCARLERLAHELLRQALDEYDHVGPPQQRNLPKNVWKSIKSHENCTVFAKSSKAAAATLLDPLTTITDNDHIPPLRNAPDLVLTGTVPGTLDDVLYGMSACDSADVLLRTAYVDESLLDGAVLLPLQLPTPTDPFRFLGIKWTVRDMPATNAITRKATPRDFVHLEASGVVTRRNGVRLGYVLQYPLELATCPELASSSQQRPIVRGRLAMTALYTPLANHTVDIFARSQVQLGGSSKPNGSVAHAVAAAALLSSATAVVCAHSKKLAWLLREQLRRGGADPAVPVVRANMFACGMCDKKFGKLSSVGTCRICCVQMCSRCRMARALSFVTTTTNGDNVVNNVANTGNCHALIADTGSSRQLEHINGTFCKNCIAHAKQSSAFDVASADVQRGRYGHVADDDTNSTTTTTARPGLARLESHPPLPTRTTATQRTQQPTTTIATTPMSFDSSRSTDVSHCGSQTSSCCSNEDCDAPLDEVSGDAIGVNCNSNEFSNWTTAATTDVATHCKPYAPPPPFAGGAPSHERQELWRKMTELRLQAESVYQLTKKTSDQHMSHHHNSSNSVDVYDSDVEDID